MLGVKNMPYKSHLWHKFYVFIMLMAFSSMTECCMDGWAASSDTWQWLFSGLRRQGVDESGRKEWLGGGDGGRLCFRILFLVLAWAASHRSPWFWTCSNAGAVRGDLLLLAADYLEIGSLVLVIFSRDWYSRIPNHEERNKGLKREHGF